jgi:RNA polymerase sigma-70 factor (ECF subfamily)
LKARVAQKRGGGEISLVLEELEQCISGVGNAENAYMAKELGKTINAFVRTLPERERNLFIRRYFYSEPLGQIAEKYHLTAHNATVILSRVRQKLKNYLEQEGFYL